MPNSYIKSVAIIVAHPDDETLWAGGTILSHPSWQCFIVCLCRGNDPRRAPRFYQALKELYANGNMGDMDDGPEQFPLSEETVESAILAQLPKQHFDLVITHSPDGEYTKHLRHEETGRAVIRLWKNGKISANKLWIFAYEDGDNKYLPRAIETETLCSTLSVPIWTKKYSIINQTYGFKDDSWEAETTPSMEAFRPFSDAEGAMEWL